MNRGTKSLCRTLKKKLHATGKGLSLLLVLTLLLSLLPAQTFAADITINGAGNGITGATSNVSGAYNIWATSKVLGYRFALTDENGDYAHYSLLPHDVYSDANLSSFLKSHSSLAHSTTKYNKTALMDSYETISLPVGIITSKSASDHADGVYSFLDTDCGVTLPGTAAEMTSWPDATNIGAILGKLWGRDVKTMANNNWFISIEPIYAVKIGGQYMALTVTETAIAAVSDGTAYNSGISNFWDAKTNNASDSTSWVGISGYTHAQWPMSLYLTEDALGMNAPSRTLTTNYAGRGTAREIITEGYGVMVVSAEDLKEDDDSLVVLSLEGFLDGYHSHSLMHDQTGEQYCTVDIYINGELAADDVTTWNVAYPSGTAYEIKDIKPSPGKSFIGVVSGSLKGTVTDEERFVSVGLEVISSQHTFCYHGNGGYYNRHGSNFDMLHTYADYGEAWSIRNNMFVREGYYFVGWTTNPDGTGDDIDWLNRNSSNWSLELGQVINLYAMWAPGDDGSPEIEAIDRWFTLNDAQTGKITLEELMSSATATDSPIGYHTDFAAGEGVFTIIDYDADDFTSFECSGSITVTYFAEDFGGNVAHKTVKIFIVDEGVHNGSSSTADALSFGTRFISKEYYWSGEGTFVGEADGGLNPQSKWLSDSNYVDLLSKVLNNTKEGSGWTTTAYSFTLDKQSIAQMKDSIEANGIGTELEKFYEDFLAS